MYPPARTTKLLPCLFLFAFLQAQAQDKSAIKYNLNETGTHYIQATLLNQTWLRFNQSNPGTLVEGVSKDNTFDIGLRRTRIQLIGKISDRVLLYFQFGQNNFNSQFNSGGNRKLAPFFHDALCEYNVGKADRLKIGAGLTIANGLSRFSQPGIATIMTLDVPVFAQTTVDQTDEFSRKLSLYARGQMGHFDYRFALSDPFPISSAGNALPPLSEKSTYAQRGHQLQYQGYLIYQFFDQESHLTPYMPGTYLGKKKVLNLAAGMIQQPDAMWHKAADSRDTTYQAMQHFAVEAYLDMPLNSEKKTALSAYTGYFNTNYGTNYLRMNGIMNPANGTSLTAANGISGQGAVYGNALPMFGTGDVVYTQLGFLLPQSKRPGVGRCMPYASATFARYKALNGLAAQTFAAGLNYFIQGHNAKLTLDVQNRPVFSVNNGAVASDGRKNQVTMQYQIFF